MLRPVLSLLHLAARRQSLFLLSVLGKSARLLLRLLLLLLLGSASLAAALEAVLGASFPERPVCALLLLLRGDRTWGLGLDTGRDREESSSVADSVQSLEVGLLRKR